MATNLNSTDLQGIKIHKLPSDSDFTSERLAIAANPTTGKLYKVTLEQWITLLSGLNVSYKGAATTSTDPGTPTTPQFYTATAVGTYTNFKDSSSTALAIASGDGLVIFSFDGTNWSKQSGVISLADYAKSDDVMLSDSYIFPSINLIDNSKVIAGYWNGTTGAAVTTDNHIKTPKIQIDPSQSTISVGGMGNINSAAGRFCFYDNSGTFISSSNALTGVTIPSTAMYVGISIYNGADSGLDPTNSVYKDTLIARYGVLATPYIAYSTGINANKIETNSLNEIIDSNETVADIKDFNGDIKYISKNIFDKTQAETGAVSVNGTTTDTSTNWVRSGLIEFQENTYVSTSGHSNTTSTALAIAFYNSGKTFISGVAMSGQTSYSVESPSGTAYIRFGIANVTDVGVTPTDNSYVNNFMANVGTEVLDWEPDQGINLIDATKIYGSLNTSKEMYYEFDVDGYNDKEQFIFYVKRKNGTNYVGIKVAHDYDMDELVYKDLYRILGADEYKLEDGSMTQVSTLTMVYAESECVYQAVDRAYTKADFSGGWHGDEIYSKVKFLIDGVLISLTDDIALTPCTEARYIQYSQIHEAPDLINDVATVVSGHPVECDHIKETAFGYGGYETKNTLIWAGNKPNFWYHGICCMGKNQAAAGYDEDFAEISFTGTTDHIYPTVGNREFTYYNTDNSLGAHITSRLIAPADVDPNCKPQLWDRVSDSKYYRQTPDADTAENDKWKSIMTVTFKQES